MRCRRAPESPRDLLELLLRARHEHHRPASPSDLQRRRAADSLRGAGDHGLASATTEPSDWARTPPAAGIRCPNARIVCALRTARSARFGRHGANLPRARRDQSPGDVRGICEHMFAHGHRRLRPAPALRADRRRRVIAPSSCVPAALAPEPGGLQQVGEVSLAAEAFGVFAGMRLGEALSRCPRLVLVPPIRQVWPIPGSGCWSAWSRSGRRSSLNDPAWPASTPAGCCGCTAASRECWRRVAGHCGCRPGWASRRRVSRRSPPPPGRGHDSRRSCAHRRRQRDAYLAPRCPSCPFSARGPALAALPEALERLGIEHARRARGLPAAALADRFGRSGLHARKLALGGDGELVLGRRRGPREALELPERAPATSSSGHWGCSSIGCWRGASAVVEPCGRS